MLDLTSLPTLPLTDSMYLPDIPAVYFVCQGRNVLYIGAASLLGNRWHSHHRIEEFRKLDGVSIKWEPVTALDGLRQTEARYIEEFQPSLNSRRRGVRQASGDPVRSIKSVRLDARERELLMHTAKRLNLSEGRVVAALLMRYSEAL